jgi:alpha-1,3(6)-mannosylglycoprotein beta-1,6-N-acetyl-glucosaminyltransferase
MPYEFTEEGMLQRVNAYILHQDFCSKDYQPWPPNSNIQVIAANAGQSCKAACRQRDLICEPSHFARLNSADVMKQHSLQPCASVAQRDDIYFPAWEAVGNNCVLQKERLLYSCVGAISDLKRICPCRDYIKGQTALCANCAS